MAPVRFRKTIFLVRCVILHEEVYQLFKTRQDESCHDFKGVSHTSVSTICISGRSRILARGAVSMVSHTSRLSFLLLERVQHRFTRMLPGFKKSCLIRKYWTSEHYRNDVIVRICWRFSKCTRDCRQYLLNASFHPVQLLIQEAILPR